MSSATLPQIQDALALLGEVVELGGPLDAIIARVAALELPTTTHLQDVCLAAACLEGDYRAAEYLIVRYGQPMRAVVRRACLSASDAEDVLQDVLVKVLVGRPPAPPALQGYRGQGPLQAWLSVVAARVGVDLVRQPRTTSLADTLLSSIAMPAPAPHDLPAGRKHDFKRAVGLALDELDNIDRQVLRLHLSGLVAEQIGRAVGLHRVSVARRISSIRDKLREKVLARMGVAADELADDVSQLSVSLERMLTQGLGHHQ
ncbi:MAG: sigma-70 family RNA polymerase sigma factor [Myxococcales bacterium]|nr:sigma-70 family RNA polymerase sigma factor [Myxococcales bacterium]